MGKTAFLFAGQGTQTLGMARDLYDAYPIVRQTYADASVILGYDLRQLIDSDEERLHDTAYTQPAILTTSLAIYRLLEQEGVSPDVVAGLSLGEYSALVAAGAIDFKQAVHLVAKRGQLMSEAIPFGQGKMVAVLNTPVTVIESICQQITAEGKGCVSPANYNTPQQIVIGGDKIAVDKAVEALKVAGYKRCIALKVSGPFHTPLMTEASEAFAKILDPLAFNSFTFPLISNTEAQVMRDEKVKHLLKRQMKEPVRFYDSLIKMKEMGVDQIIEIGPGQVLSGFVKKIDKDLKVVSITDQDSFEEWLKDREESVYEYSR